MESEQIESEEKTENMGRQYGRIAKFIVLITIGISLVMILGALLYAYWPNSTPISTIP
jgi:cell division septal protein FtsQ